VVGLSIEKYDLFYPPRRVLTTREIAIIVSDFDSVRAGLFEGSSFDSVLVPLGLEPMTFGFIRCHTK
jgi:hypothetical protein